ncbi:MAG: hypothetical protein ACP5JV_08990 [Thermus sp.]|uniref:hypothetical protein n=1 Tax=Thermus sp. TaxID=275 RepID=UPI003D126ECD
MDDVLGPDDRLPLLNAALQDAHTARKRAKRAMERLKDLEARVAQLEARALAKATSYETGLGDVEDRLTRLTAFVKTLARRVKALEAAFSSHQVEEEAREEAERARRLAEAKEALEALAPKVFALRGGDPDVLVMADHLRGRLEAGDLEAALPVLARWKAEVGRRG